MLALASSVVQPQHQASGSKHQLHSSAGWSLQSEFETFNEQQAVQDQLLRMSSHRSRFSDAAQSAAGMQLAAGFRIQNMKAA